ncbi:Uu.00g082190.m01.CDS01 [Anthostomella pinea]|uniref:Uu.00g082190.m01.CDS01 n=1 Tax=Anthostomella pinea TaxID=933095 RepID=A0AAI8VLE7_9PEZI|nr:Uu.00g082190.m01.CDS01 [Anthostomella pinea]
MGGDPGANVEAVANFTKKTHNDTYAFISPKQGDLSGRSVFITGASKGIGRETALSYARAGCGKIAIGARSDLSSLATEIKEAASNAGLKTVPKVLSIKIDVTSEDSVKSAADTITKEFGGALDVLVCNAGYLEEWHPIGESKPDDWWRTYEINVRGVYLCSRYFIPLLLRGIRKTCIITSSVGALLISPEASAYQTTKFAVCRLAEFMAAEYKDKELVCIAIHPGGVKTELAYNMPEYMHKALVDEPQLAADTIAWLGKEHRPWLSGRYVTVKWDMGELEARKDEIVKGDLLKFRLTC